MKLNQLYENTLTDLNISCDYRGNFFCNNNKLTSLVGAPTEVDGIFICGSNKLTSLEGAPTKVGDSFYCNKNLLISLKGAPTKVSGIFDCSNNKLTSLEGAPTEVGRSFGCSNNKLTSLEGIHKQIKSINGHFIAAGNKLESNLLGLILIDGIEDILIDNKQICSIMKKYLLQSNKKVAMLQCQQELIEAGFEEAAQL